MQEIFNKYKLLKEKLKQLKKFKQLFPLKFLTPEKYPEQTEIIDFIVNRVINQSNSHIKFVVVFGGNRSGKTETGAISIAKIFEHSNFAIMCAAITSKLSILVQQKKINDYITKQLINDNDYNKRRGFKNALLEATNGTSINFKAYEQGVDTFQADDFDFIWLDEECSWSILQECIMRTTDRNGLILLTFTSLKGFTRIVNMLWETSRKDIFSKTLTIFQNPYLDDIGRQIVLDAMDPDEYESRALGKPKMKTGLVFKSYGDIHKIEPFEYKQLVLKRKDRYRLVEGIDPHTRTPHHWLRLLYDKQDDILYVVDELKAPKESMLVADFARLIKAKRKNIVPEYTQIDTSSQTPNVIAKKLPDEYQENVSTIRSEFADNGIETILCAKDNDIGLNAIKHRLKVVRNITGEVKRKPKLYVFKSCLGFSWEMARYSWDNYATESQEEKKEMINRVLKKNDHFIDILKYECIKIARKEGKADAVKEESIIYEDIGY